MAFGFNYSQNGQGRTQMQPINRAMLQGQRQQQAPYTPQGMRGALGQLQRQPRHQQPPSNRGMMRQGVTAGRSGPAASRQRSQMQMGAPLQQNTAPQPNNGNLPDGVTYQPLDDKTIAEIGSIAPNHPAVMAFQQNQQSQQPGQNTLFGQSTQTGLNPQFGQNTQTGLNPQFGQNTQTGLNPQFNPNSQPGKNSQYVQNSQPEQNHQQWLGTQITPQKPVINLVEQLEKFMQNERNGAVYYERLAAIAEGSSQAEALRGISESCSERMRSYNALYRKQNAVDFQTSETQVMSVRTLQQGITLALKEEEFTVNELIKLYESMSDVEARHVLSAQLYKKISDLGTLHRMFLRD